jgi:uncharacterized RDD family membrane protein YckC
VLMVWGFIWMFSTFSNRTLTCSTSGTIDCGKHVSWAGIIPIVIAGLLFIGWYVYVVVAIGGARGATVGMRALKMRCVRDETFDQVGIGKSLGRLLITWAFGAIGSLVGLVDSLFPLWDAKRQTLHDKVVSTVVLYEG